MQQATIVHIPTAPREGSYQCYLETFSECTATHSIWDHADKVEPCIPNDYQPQRALCRLLVSLKLRQIRQRLPKSETLRTLTAWKEKPRTAVQWVSAVRFRQ